MNALTEICCMAWAPICYCASIKLWTNWYTANEISTYANEGPSNAKLKAKSNLIFCIWTTYIYTLTSWSIYVCDGKNNTAIFILFIIIPTTIKKPKKYLSCCTAHHESLQCGEALLFKEIEEKQQGILMGNLHFYICPSASPAMLTANPTCPPTSGSGFRSLLSL